MSAMIAAFLRPIRKFHSDQCKLMRSAPEALAWHQAQASGAHMATMNEVMSLLVDEVVMEQLRLGVVPEGHTIRDLFEAHPVVVEDTKLAGKCGSFALALVGRRMKSHGLPQRSASAPRHEGHLEGLRRGQAEDIELLEEGVREEHLEHMGGEGHV